MLDHVPTEDLSTDVIRQTKDQVSTSNDKEGHAVHAALNNQLGGAPSLDPVQ